MRQCDLCHITAGHRINGTGECELAALGHREVELLPNSQPALSTVCLRVKPATLRRKLMSSACNIFHIVADLDFFRTAKALLECLDTNKGQYIVSLIWCLKKESSM